MDAVRKRSPSEILKRGYTDEEIAHIYELARLSLELGEMHRADLLVSGIIEVAPEFLPARLAKGYIALHSEDFEGAVAHAQHVLQFDPQHPQGMLLLVTAFLNTGDYNQAGTLLGEIGDGIEEGRISEPQVIRYFRMQLARYQTRRSGS